ncbi:MAG: type 1 periplasmic binding fold superfamily protein [Bacteroidetes bacterium]|nr:type 1 periplasmic binding fold superfamily protein [Bacteroidota bacterium]
MSKIIYQILLLSITAFIFQNCNQDDPVPEHQEELITTLIMTFTDMSGGQQQVFSFRDLDGEGGNAPVITNAVLEANSSYDVTIEVLNESVSPSETITEEVEEEADEHQFFFSIAGSLNLEFTYDDEDANSRPLGLETTFTTGAASTGTLAVILRHEPDKAATGVSNGDITNAGGETDIEVTFDVTIQ